MLKKIKVENFKSIKNIELKLSNINLFCGTNSSGKSTLLQSILMLSQNETVQTHGIAAFNGSIIQLGDFIDIKNFGISRNEPIKISGEVGETTFNFEVASDVETTEKGVVTQAMNLHKFSFDDHLYYLSSDRIGSVELHDTSSISKFGKNGEYTIDFLEKNVDLIVPRKMTKENKNDSTLFFEVDHWLKYIVDSKLKVDKVLNTSKKVVTYCNGESKRYVRSINTGTGISYLISIIILCLGAIVIDKEKRPIIIIENPEIHLHPRAQSRVLDFLVFISNFSQVIVETQSDHIFNSFRVSQKKGIISKDTGKVYFSEYSTDCSIFTEIIIDANGTVTNNIEGLFDQFQFDLVRLLG